MVVEGVTFVEEEVRKMSCDTFVEQMVDTFFQDREKKKRETMLTDIYRRITQKKVSE